MRLMLVGCGKMGGAMLEGWLDDGLPPANVTIVDPAANKPEATWLSAWRDRGVLVVEQAGAVPSGQTPDVVLFAVKPQVIDALISEYKEFAEQGALVLSVVAGKTISFFEEALGAQTAVVRTMPNTPAAVGRGMTVLCANALVPDRMKEQCAKLLSAVGETAWIEDEALMDAVTGVSGSGPAYIFHMAEALAEAGVAAGLPRELAVQLANATVSGAGELLRQSPDTPATLRQNVTSPGGTTQAGLNVLMHDEKGLVPLMTAVVDAAAKRSRELS
ncbi:pyrroline-5-carboxylate reductase [Kiloniella sp. b19]|uniref:pyrroline-5-carboxylate reductase n=1 Tax=Kiloniella sp. GXU_MW_B19 TaxID=3141326 RepID=UPI0031D01518